MDRGKEVKSKFRNAIYRVSQTHGTKAAANVPDKQDNLQQPSMPLFLGSLYFRFEVWKIVEGEGWLELNLQTNVSLHPSLPKEGPSFWASMVATHGQQRRRRH